MPAELVHSRGDVHLGNKKNLKNGQIFLSYINTDQLTSNQHSYSQGQLWSKDPSSEKLVEIANARSIDSLIFKGYIDKSFSGDFINASEEYQADFKHCHEGDFWIFKEDNLKDFTEPFYKKDILLITKAIYKETVEGPFRESLKDVQYIRIAVSNAEDVQRLNYKLQYCGEFSNLQTFYDLKKQKGNLYIATAPVSILKTCFDLEETDLRYPPEENKFVKILLGDFVWWNGEKWEIIPSGYDYKASKIAYTPNEKSIDTIKTFEDWQKELLKTPENVQEALDILNTTKAQLDENGKVSYSQLPDALKNSLSLQGKFYPIISRTENQNDPNNQNPWPETEDGSEMLSGYYWIVDCYKKQNVQYIDKTQPNRVIELNDGDWIVWVEATNQFEVLDNSDRVTSIDVINPDNLNKTSLTGNVGIVGEGINVSVSGNNVKLSFDGDVLTQDPTTGDGPPGYFPIYGPKKNQLVASELYQTVTEIVSRYHFQIGSSIESKNLKTFGNIGIIKTPGTTATTYINNFLYFETLTLTKKNKTVARTTQLKASDRNNFIEKDEILDIRLPEVSSLLVGITENDSLTSDYFTKTSFDGFITDTLLSEVAYTDKNFAENSQEGFENVGIGRLASEDVDIGELTFFAKTKSKSQGFYTKSTNTSHSSQSSRLEHFLNRNAKAKTHLIINPTTLEEEAETFVQLPFISGTLITWEEAKLLVGLHNGIPLMIPVWEEMEFHQGKFVGLDTSPITIRINRSAHDSVKINRTNDLSKAAYGKDSAWSYINSSKENSIQDEERTSIDDFVSFDAWVESQRAVVSKEAFILPATSTQDGESTLDMQMMHHSDDLRETVYKDYSRVKYQRILPSRTLYKDEPVYYDPVSGALIAQNVTSKDIEMPAVGGVILTSRSRIEGGFWGQLGKASTT